MVSKVDTWNKKMNRWNSEIVLDRHRSKSFAFTREWDRCDDKDQPESTLEIEELPDDNEDVENNPYQIQNYKKQSKSNTNWFLDENLRNLLEKPYPGE